MILNTPDALLVGDRSKFQEVNLVVKELVVAADVELAELPATMNQPWSMYATLKVEDGCQDKRITVTPGQILSLQYYQNTPKNPASPRQCHGTGLAMTSLR